jgi:cytochrome c-type biogenesis protein CcmF
MPARKTAGDTLLSRDFAFFLAVTLMLVSCAVVTLGTTTPLFQGWMHKPVAPPKPTWYNHVMLPIAVITALLLGCVPWMAWSKTNPEAFRKRLTLPWIVMLVFGFFMVFWVGSAQRALFSALDPSTTEYQETMHAWVNASVQRISVVALASVACLAALSNAMLAYKVFRKKPLNAGGWIAHVGIGILMIGVIVSNTYERTSRITIQEGQGPQTAFGYQFQFERMTGKPLPVRPINPDYDRNNAIELRVTPPDAGSAGPSDGGPRTYLADLSWFVHNIDTTDNEDKFERMRWPSINKSIGHDLYVGLADDPGFELPTITLQPKERRDVGPYRIGYFDSVVLPQRRFQATLAILPPGGKPIVANPAQVFVRDPDGMRIVNEGISIPELADENGVPGAIYLQKMQPGTHAATFLLSLPEYKGHWEIPLEVTYKPWINLVWLGVIIATFGTLMAMVRRIIEQRRGTGGDDEEFLELGAPAPTDVTPVAAAQIVTSPGKKRRLATQRQN